MAGGDRKIQPIVIKRVRKPEGHGSHNSAWKIAYADFVTAMMAFFLLMWLLGSTTKGDLKGISDYFNTPLQVALVGGSGSGESNSVIRGGGADITREVGQVRQGETESPRRPVTARQAAEELQREADEQARLIRSRVESVIERNPRLREMRSQVRMDVTPEGLRIEIVDEHNRPMFASGSAVVQPYMRELLHEIAQVLNEVERRITLTGHTDAAPFQGGERGYSNWELSADRANASRRELLAGGMDEGKILRVVGLAAVLPREVGDPLAPVNRRISIVVMNRLAERRLLSGSELPAVDAQQLGHELSRLPGADTEQPAAAGAQSVRR